MKLHRLHRTRRAMLSLADWVLWFPINILDLCLTWLLPFVLGLCCMSLIIISLQLRWIDNAKARKLLRLQEERQEERDAIDNMKLIDEDHGMLIFTGVNPDTGLRPHFMYQGIENVLYINEYFAESFKVPVDRIMVRVIPNRHKKNPESPDTCLETEYMCPSMFKTYQEQVEEWKKFGWRPLVQVAKDSDKENSEWLENPWHD